LKKSSTTTERTVESSKVQLDEAQQGLATAMKSPMRTMKNPTKVKRFCTEKYKLHQQEMSAGMHQIECLSGAAKGKDPLDRQEGHLASGTTSSRRSFDLKKEGRGATGLVGETKREAILISSATSTDTGKRESGTIVLVGEISKVLQGE